MRRKKTQQYQTHTKPCEWPGCMDHAQFPAPKSRKFDEENTSKDLFYFCLSHVREYNLSWDFFKGMQQQEIEKFQKEAMIGHRPTKKIREYRFLASEIFSGMHDVFEEMPKRDAPKQYLPVESRQALEVLELSYPVSLDEIKVKYKLMAKIHHPDLNGGNKNSEEKFKMITEAYKHLVNSEQF